MFLEVCNCESEHTFVKPVPAPRSQTHPIPISGIPAVFFLLSSPSNSRLRLRGIYSNVPILIPIQESREDSVQVCAGADEEQDHEEEGLELEDAELFETSH
jgi:hypothetical protein